jgi:hypothetical protein
MSDRFKNPPEVYETVEKTFRNTKDDDYFYIDIVQTIQNLE